MRGLQPPASAVPLFLWLLGTFPTGTCHWSHLNLTAEKCGVQFLCSLPIPCSPRSMFTSHREAAQGWTRMGDSGEAPRPRRSSGVRGTQGWGIVGAPAWLPPSSAPCVGMSLSCSFAPCLTAMGPQHQVSPWHGCSHGSSILGKMWGRILGAEPPQVLLSRSPVPVTFRVAAPPQTRGMRGSGQRRGEAGRPKAEQHRTSDASFLPAPPSASQRLPAPRPRCHRRCSAASLRRTRRQHRGRSPGRDTHVGP